MSRHGYIEDCDYEDNLAQGRWQAQLKSSIRGKRGQVFFRALVEALDALPEKSLVSQQLAREVMYTNDEAWLGPGAGDSNAARWQQVRAWAVKQIIPTEAELAATSEAAPDA